MYDLSKTTYNPEVRLAQRWYPKGAMAINHPDSLGTAYAYICDRTGKWAVVAYRGTAGKSSFHFTYRSREQAEKAVGDWLQGLTEHAKLIAERRVLKPHTFKPGDIVTNSWGYDQTNVDWYRVTRATKHFVWLKPIAANVVEDGFMSGPSMPQVDTASDDPNKWGFVDKNEPEEQHKAEGEHVCMEYGSGSKWDGKARYCSWYA